VHKQVDARLERRDLAGAERDGDGRWRLCGLALTFLHIAAAADRTRHGRNRHDDVQVKVHFRTNGCGKSRREPSHGEYSEVARHVTHAPLSLSRTTNTSPLTPSTLMDTFENIEKKITELQGRDSDHQEQIRALRTRRNALTPLCRLFPDILSRVFHLLVLSDHKVVEYDLA
jgi:hypothetical protein